MSFVEEAAIYVGILAVIILTGLGVTVVVAVAAALRKPHTKPN